MSLYELIRSARSYRAFEPGVKMSESLLISFVENARISSATMNLQPLKYRLVTDEQEISCIVSHTRWATSLKNVSLPPENMGPSAFIVICHDENVTPYRDIFLKDVGICSEVIMLSAAEAGYGACILGSFDGEVARALNIPKDLSVKSVIALGKPAERVELLEAHDGNVTYFRDEHQTHYVPKRTLDDIIIK